MGTVLLTTLVSSTVPISQPRVFVGLSGALGTEEGFLRFVVQGFSQLFSVLGTEEGFLRFVVQGFSKLFSVLGTARCFL